MDAEEEAHSKGEIRLIEASHWTGARMTNASHVAQSRASWCDFIYP